MTYSSLFNEEAIEPAKEHHENYGDEISLTFVGLTCRDLREGCKTKELPLWFFSEADKKEITDFMFHRFNEGKG